MIIPVSGNWRIVVLDENETPVECPVVAWYVVQKSNMLEPKNLEPFICGPQDPHLIWRPMEDRDWEKIVCYLAPDQKMDAGIVEAAEDQAKAYRKDE